MDLGEVRELCIGILAKGPDITSADSWQDSTRPCGLVITYSSGARLWTAITMAGATGTDSVRASTAPTAPLLPALYDTAGRITPQRAQCYLAGVLMSAHAPQVISAYGYAPSAKHPGVGVHLADGGRAFLPFVFTAAPGRKPARTPFTIDATF
ncbi:hypothetical protein [Streptomyces sp. NBC_01601]|uniref:hypothetical protein n=1 Tax=Streptomyces sp. NBC_01601 TaxID=2975892 RepID=UPI002E2CC1A2|nr:hypothetical protein [Streptomyces sp. NBC_01601]